MRIVFILILLAFVNTASFGYVPGARIDSVRDYMTAAIVHEFLKEYVASGDFDKYNSYDWDKYTSYKKIESQLLTNSIESPLPITTLSRLLRYNNFEKTNNQFVERAKYIVVSQSSYVDSVPNMLMRSFEKIVKGLPLRNTVEKIKPQLIADVTARLRLLNTTDTIIADNDKINDKDSPSLIGTLLLIIVLIGFFVFVKNLVRSKRTLPNSSFSGKEIKKDVELKSTVNKVSDLLVEVDLSTKEENTKPEISGSKELPQKSNSRTKKEKNKAIINADIQNDSKLIEVFIPTKDVEVRLFYMRNPEKGFFPVDRMTDNSNMGNAMFKFYEISKSEAEYEILNNDIVKSILKDHKNITEYILPACEFENKSNANSFGVEVLARGVVRLDNNRWDILRKCKVKYLKTDDDLFSSPISNNLNSPNLHDDVANHTIADKQNIVTSIDNENVLDTFTKETSTKDDTIFDSDYSSEKQIIGGIISGLLNSKNIAINSNESPAFYSPAPYGNHFIGAMTSKQYRKDISMYEFFVDHTNSSATFKLISDEACLNKLKNNHVLDFVNACRFTADMPQNLSNVITVKTGKVDFIKKNDKWEINERAIIGFE